MEGEKSPPRMFLIDILSVLFGIGTWVCINGLWVELPLLVSSQPEAWKLPSYMSVVIQIANVGPLTYSILQSIFPKYIKEKPAIYLTMTIGCVSTVFLALFWEKTTYVFGANRSTVLLALVFCLAMVDCSSRVLFLPFMASFKEIYLTSFFIGEGLSGFVPSMIALAQGVGGNPVCQNVTKENATDITYEQELVYEDPLFSVDVFFYLLFAIMVTSAVAFHLLNYKPLVMGSLVTQPNAEIVLLGSNANHIPSYQATSPGGSRHLNALNEDTSSDDGSETGVHIVGVQPRIVSRQCEEAIVKDTFLTQVSKPMFLYLLAIQALVCCLANGVFPSIQSYSCLPYGNQAYHWAVTLSSMANPAVCFLAFYIPPPTKASVTGVSGLGLVVAAYVFATAVMSPVPPLVESAAGEILLVLVWILMVAFFTYAKVSVATILRAEGKKGLFWCGAVTQIGSAVGAIVMFFIVNLTTVFQGYTPTCGN